VLRRIRSMRSRGASYDRIARRLNITTTPAKRGGKWFAMTVRSVLLTNERMELV
jgi:Recombinase